MWAMTTDLYPGLPSSSYGICGIHNTIAAQKLVAPPPHAEEWDMFEMKGFANRRAARAD